MYTTKTTKISNGKGYWDSLLVEIFQDENKIGEYKRNYDILYATFYPFKQGEKEYALYSPCYTATRIMELPSCKDICGEDENSAGFCPTGYFVPYTTPEVLKLTSADLSGNDPFIGPNGQFGFVCGCVWGDDTSWKIQFLDLSKISEGIFKRDDRFGYIEMLNSHEELSKCIEVDEFTQKQYDSGNVKIDIAIRKRFNLKR
jgi:hypothetical protein